MGHKILPHSKVIERCEYMKVKHLTCNLWGTTWLSVIYQSFRLCMTISWTLIKSWWHGWYNKINLATSLRCQIPTKHSLELNTLYMVDTIFFQRFLDFPQHYFVITHKLYGFVKTHCFIFFLQGCIISLSTWSTLVSLKVMFKNWQISPNSKSHPLGVV